MTSTVDLPCAGTATLVADSAKLPSAAGFPLASVTAGVTARVTAVSPSLR
ncbi:hypothetical protein [Fodinicola feengrottensis]|nr:hypothetical protein [Fodinicola feengrottensis]